MKQSPAISVILPCYEEEGNVAPLVEEIHAALGPLALPYEVLCVEDGSRDGTLAELERLAAADPRVRLLRHSRNFGQSAAVASGLRAARGGILLTLDADGQNDPADLPRLVAALQDADLVCGVRRRRQDDWLRRLSSRIGNRFRDLVTGVGILDAGCALRAMRRDAVVELPVFNGIHRFLPSFLKLQGARVKELEVQHRPRRHGTSKYGIHNRLWRGLFDCLVFLWWRRRVLPVRRLVAEAVAEEPLPQVPAPARAWAGSRSPTAGAPVPTLPVSRTLPKGGA